VDTISGGMSRYSKYYSERQTSYIPHTFTVTLGQQFSSIPFTLVSQPEHFAPSYCPSIISVATV